MTQQIQLDSKRIEAAICFYRALKAFPALKDRSCLDGKHIPPPIMDIVLKMVALNQERNNLVRFPTEIKDKEAFFFQEIARGEALYLEPNQDGSFIHTALRDR